MKKTAFTLLAILFSTTLFAQKPACRHQFPDYKSALNSRSDTIDVLNYHINLDITDFITNQIAGFTTVTFSPKLNNVSTLDLDLLQMVVDSVVMNGTLLTYQYNDTLLRLSFPAVLSASDTEQVSIYYHGTPQTDPSGWGGFYFQNGYAFNLGVGFKDDPHNYGRVWFPCFDNFVERSSYDFTITSILPKKAHCNGALISETISGTDTLTRHWQLNDEIPTYLACVAVAEYATVHQSFNGMNGTVPIELAALPADTTNLKNSFIHLPDALTTYESSYGPYVWNKVGYSLVPFSSGAMEHATNIAYPRLAANGSTALETLMAHELSHHWWGDLITCRTAEDMWLNEGWATYSEHIFLENLYGQDSYIQTVKENVEDLVHYAHLRENGYRAVSGIPHQYTYGEHVYQKGAAVAHTLRSYMGDAAFFSGIQSFITANAFKDVSSTDLLNHLSPLTTADLSSFFNDWVFNGGWPHFYIDSVQKSISGLGTFNTVHLQQRVKGAPDLFENVPVEITFMDTSFNTYTDTFIASGSNFQRSFNLPIDPVYYTLNYNNKIAQAVGDEKMWIKNTGLSNLPLSHVSVNVTSVTDSVFLRFEHNWVGTDNQGVNPSQVRFSDNHFWRIDGVLKPGFDAKLKFFYDGRLTTSGGGGYYDHDLIGTNEDSVILMFRKGPGHDWEEHPSYIMNPLGSTTNKFGFVETDTLMTGEYTFAYGDRVFLKMNEDTPSGSGMKVFPNPAKNEIQVTMPESVREGTLKLYNLVGSLLAEEKSFSGSEGLNISNLPSGIYTVELSSGGRRWQDKVVISR